MTGTPFQPRSAEPFNLVVERGKVREFARACRSDDPAYLDDEAAVTPPTFLMSAVFWQGPGSAAPRVAGGYERILHGEQEFVFLGEPPRVGTRLTGVARLDSVYEKQGRRGGAMVFQELVTEFRDQQGTLVAEARSTVIVTSTAPPPGP